MHRVECSDTPEHQSIRHCIAADSIFPMHAARHFAGSIESGNNRAFGVENLCIAVNLNAPIVWCTEGVKTVA